ncbi:DUF397 domain-containing protein [Actinomadura sp. HBU206391]|uniref:DUF397 domain-containing protein n=1 Tax=Actinomadura sp. HBU206391 TaxID=2731692 RepID=UPI0016509EF4|nr:DUF397 domain-containing protein [Actinomadura sp. HBU206391]MBC6459447.1 DUF397 domain-containing protein [Actinomadura sp. HBU206391]
MDLSGLRWRKSSRSTDNGGNCVELAALPGMVAVRDSKNPEGGVLFFPRKTFRAFTAELN